MAKIFTLELNTYATASTGAASAAGAAAGSSSFFDFPAPRMAADLFRFWAAHAGAWIKQIEIMSSKMVGKFHKCCKLFAK